MNIKKIRPIIHFAILAIVSIGYVTKFGIGTISALGWQDISLLCPLGALGTMLAEKALIPRALVSLVIVVILIVILGKAFCSWVCPVPTVRKLRNLFKKKESNQSSAGTNLELEGSKDEDKVADADVLTENESAEISSCKHKSTPQSSRLWVLGGALLSTAIFGYPVFCLVCPIGLTFATVLLVVRMFVFGDVTWTIVIVPALLLVEVVVFRKWCHMFCPLGAFMGLISKANRFFRPSIDDALCVETAKGGKCQRCAEVCPEGINPRKLASGAPMSECTKCHACVDVCHTKALSMPLFTKSGGGEADSLAGGNRNGNGDGNADSLGTIKPGAAKA